MLGETQRCSSAPIKTIHFGGVATQREARRCRKQARPVKVKQGVLRERSYQSCPSWVHAGKAPTYLSSGSGSTRCRRSGEEIGQASRWHFPPSPYSPPTTVHVETREKTRTFTRRTCATGWALASAHGLLRHRWKWMTFLSVWPKEPGRENLLTPGTTWRRVSVADLLTDPATTEAARSHGSWK